MKEEGKFLKVIIVIFLIFIFSLIFLILFVSVFVYVDYERDLNITLVRAFCTNGTIANVILRNIGTFTLFLRCIPVYAADNITVYPNEDMPYIYTDNITIDCMDLKVIRTQGFDKFGPSFSNDDVVPSETVLFTDTGCGLPDRLETCVYKFYLPMQQTSIFAKVEC